MTYECPHCHQPADPLSHAYMVFSGDAAECSLEKISFKSLSALMCECERLAESSRFSEDDLFALDFVSIRRVRSDGTPGQLVALYNLRDSDNTWAWTDIPG